MPAGSCQVGRAVFLVVITPLTAPLISVDNPSSRRTASPQEASNFLLQQMEMCWIVHSFITVAVYKADWQPMRWDIYLTEYNKKTYPVYFCPVHILRSTPELTTLN